MEKENNTEKEEYIKYLQRISNIMKENEKNNDNEEEDINKGFVEWIDVYNRMKERVKDENKIFQLLAYGLAKYDWNGANSNWWIEFGQENDIYRWTKWALSEINPDYNPEDDNNEQDVNVVFTVDNNLLYKDDIEDIIKTYCSGQNIPDASDLMIDYFC
jgi:hypothetical protein